MIILMCTYCDGIKLEKYDGKMADKGYDWVHCKECDKNMPMSKCGIREEFDTFSE